MPEARDCLEGHIILGVFLSITSIVLLVLTGFSTPYIHSINFLSTSTGLKFGSFGYCFPGGCTHRQIGYKPGPEITEWLTKALILFPVAALMIFLGLFGLVWSLWGPSRDSIWFRLPTGLGMTLALLGDIFALCLFVTARNRYHAEGIDADYGAALWLGLVGFVTALVSAIFCGPPYSARYMYRMNRNVPHHY